MAFPPFFTFGSPFVLLHYCLRHFIMIDCQMSNYRGLQMGSMIEANFDFDKFANEWLKFSHDKAIFAIIYFQKRSNASCSPDSRRSLPFFGIEIERSNKDM